MKTDTKLARVDESCRLAAIMIAAMLPLGALPVQAAIMTQAGGNAHISAGWNADVSSHPDVTLTVNDSQDASLAFLNSASNAVTLSRSGSQVVADVIDPVEVAAVPISWSVSASADASGSASPGTLHAYAHATAAQSPTTQTYAYISPQTGDAVSITKYDPVSVAGSATVDVAWDEVFTIASSTLAPGTPVTLHYTLVLDSSVQNPHGTSGAKEYLILPSSSTVIKQVANASGTSILTATGTIGMSVGASIELEGALEASAHAAAYSDPLNTNYGSVGFQEAFTSALNTGHFYFDLDPGINASIVTQSGVSYATPVPEPASLSATLAGVVLIGRLFKRRRTPR